MSTRLSSTTSSALVSLLREHMILMILMILMIIMIIIKFGGTREGNCTTVTLPPETARTWHVDGSALDCQPRAGRAQGSS